MYTIEMTMDQLMQFYVDLNARPCVVGRTYTRGRRGKALKTSESIPVEEEVPEVDLSMEDDD